MAQSLVRLLARRYVCTRRGGGFISLVAWFSMLGIMLGVATLIIVTSLMNGIRQEMLSSFIGVDGHIRIEARRGAIADYEALIGQLMPSLPLGSIAIPRIEGQVMATAASGVARGAQVIALLPGALKDKPKLADAISPEERVAFDDGVGLIIGSALAESLGAFVQEPSEQGVTLISPQGRATAFGTVPRIKAYPMAGTFTLGMHALDQSLILMPYDKAVVYFNLSQAGEHPASVIEITLPKGDDAYAVAVELSRMLGDGYAVYPWQRTHQTVFAALEIQRNVMVIILALIVLVAAFNIISSLVMLVKEKRGDVAILRTMGMSRSGITGLFMLTGMSIGVMGTLLGLGLGLIGAENLEALRQWLEALTGQPILVANIYFLSTLPTQTDPAEVVAILLASLTLTLLATIYPAYKAASIDPAEVLRGA